MKKKIVDDVLLETLSDGNLDELKERITEQIKNAMMNSIYYAMGFEYRWNHWEVNSNSPMSNRIKKLSEELVNEIELIPTPLNDKQKKALQKEFDEVYVSTLEYALRDIACEKANKDVYSLMEDEE